MPRPSNWSALACVLALLLSTNAVALRFSLTWWPSASARDVELEPVDGAEASGYTVKAVDFSSTSQQRFNEYVQQLSHRVDQARAAAAAAGAAAFFGDALPQQRRMLLNSLSGLTQPDSLTNVPQLQQQLRKLQQTLDQLPGLNQNLLQQQPNAPSPVPDVSGAQSAAPTGTPAGSYGGYNPNEAGYGGTEGSYGGYGGYGPSEGGGYGYGA